MAHLYIHPFVVGRWVGGWESVVLYSEIDLLGLAAVLCNPKCTLTVLYPPDENKTTKTNFRKNNNNNNHCQRHLMLYV